MKSIVSPTTSIVFASELRRDGLRIFRFFPLDIWGELWYPEEVIEQTFKSLTPLLSSCSIIPFTAEVFPLLSSPRPSFSLFQLYMYSCD